MDTNTTHCQVPDAEVCTPEDQLSRALQRYQKGESRTDVFCSLVIESLRLFPSEELTVLDIGCGRGFDGDSEAQNSIGGKVARFIGIEPDQEIVPVTTFTEIHRSVLENAALSPGSVHVAYSNFVLEHIQDPKRFWEKLYEVLCPGGIFWGFTVDGRHPFRFVSSVLDKFRLKEFYLNRLRGRRGVKRYENYSTFYLANTPRDIESQASMFQRADFLSIHREGQLNYYFPRVMWSSVQLAERLAMKLHLPGSVLLVRLEK